MEDYRNDLKIDEHNLDEECLKQPFLFEKYAQKLVPLYKLRDELKIEIEKFGAKLDGIIREAASAEGKKVTEATIQNEIARNVQYQDLQQKYINACAEAKEADIIKDAFQQKRDVLKILTELYIGQYWSTVTPKVIKQQGTENIKERLKEKMLQDKNENN